MDPQKPHCDCNPRALDSLTLSDQDRSPADHCQWESFGWRPYLPIDAPSVWQHAALALLRSEMHCEAADDPGAEGRILWYLSHFGASSGTTMDGATQPTRSPDRVDFSLAILFTEASVHHRLVE